MTKKLLRFISLSTGIIAIFLGLLVFRHFQPQSVLRLVTMEAPADPFQITTLFTPESEPAIKAFSPVDSLDSISNLRTTSRQEPLRATTSPIASPKVALRPRATIQPTPSPTPALAWMEFDGVSVLDSPNNMTIQPACEAKPIELPEFRVIPWSEDVLTSGAFNVTKKTAVAWEHLGFTGYWIHSGVDWLGKPLAAFPLQDYLEKINTWKFRTPEEFDQHAADCIIGSTVTLKVGDKTLDGKVNAVLRVPVTEIEAVSSHVMDLVPYLGNSYPESGFDKLQAPELLLYFCGRRLTTEREDPTIPYYAQSRIIVAIDFDS